MPFNLFNDNLEPVVLGGDLTNHLQNHIKYTEYIEHNKPSTYLGGMLKMKDYSQLSGCSAFSAYEEFGLEDYAFVCDDQSSSCCYSDISDFLPDLHEVFAIETVDVGAIATQELPVECKKTFKERLLSKPLARLFCCLK